MGSELKSVTHRLLESLEWSQKRHGVEPRQTGERAYIFEACPCCKGIKPMGDKNEWGTPIPEWQRPDNHFPSNEIGHGPGCLFPEALDEVTTTPRSTEA